MIHYLDVIRVGGNASTLAALVKKGLLIKKGFQNYSNDWSITDAGRAAVTGEGCEFDERLSWALRQFVHIVPAGKEFAVRFKVGVQEFTLGTETMPEDEVAHFAAMFVIALGNALEQVIAGDSKFAARARAAGVNGETR